MAMPQEEIQKQQEQIATGAEGPGPGGTGPYRGFDPFMQYILHKLDALETTMHTIETTLRGEIKQLDSKMEARIDNLHQELHSTTRWIIGTIIAAAGVAVALASWLFRP